jgi:putative DNA primase/helicase
VFKGERFPAMLCLVRNILTDKPQAVHRTALTPHGTAIERDGKKLRMALGPISGGVIKLDPDESVTEGLCVGEGVETCLAGMHYGYRPVWSAVNSGGVKAFPVLERIIGLHLFKENDENGTSEAAINACAARWHEAGRNVIIVNSDFGNDLADELMESSKW